MASFSFPLNSSGESAMMDFAPPPPANLTPAPTLGGEPAEPKPDEPETKFPAPVIQGVRANNTNRPGEPEWVTHSGVEGRPYLTEEIWESPNRTELFDNDRCKTCIDLGRACVTILKFPTPPALGDLDVCGYCAKDGKKKCGAGVKAFDANLKKQIRDEGQDAISKRLGRRVSTKLLSPEVTATPDHSALSSSKPARNLRRSLSSDSETSTQSAPKRPKMAIRRKKPGPKPKTSVSQPTSASALTTDGEEKYDGRKDPAKVALRVMKMKATIAAKREAKLAAETGQAAPGKKGGSRKSSSSKTIATPNAKAKAKAVTSPRTEPKLAPAPAPAAKTTLRRPRSMSNMKRGRNQVPSEEDFLTKDFVGTAPTDGRKTRTPASKVITAHRQARAARLSGSPSDFEPEVNALLGSVEAPGLGLDDDDDDEEDEGDEEVDTSGTSNFDDLEAENEKLRRSLAKLEAREKKVQLREENENLKKRIDELKRKSVSRRESSGAIV